MNKIKQYFSERPLLKKIGWAGILFFIIKGTITTAVIVYTIWWGTKS